MKNSLCSDCSYYHGCEDKLRRDTDLQETCVVGWMARANYYQRLAEQTTARFHEMDQKITQLDLELGVAMGAKIAKIEGVMFNYYTKDGYFECRYCSFGWILKEDPFADDFHMRYCPQCGYKITSVIPVDGSIQDEIEKEAE